MSGLPKGHGGQVFDQVDKTHIKRIASLILVPDTSFLLIVVVAQVIVFLSSLWAICIEFWDLS